MAIEDIQFKLQKSDNTPISAVTFGLLPNQTSAFQIQFSIEGSTLTQDATAVVSAVRFTLDQLTSGSDNSFPYLLKYYPTVSNSVLWYDVVATGENTYIGSTNTSTVTFYLSSPWLSGNDTASASTAASGIDFSASPLVCSFNIVFSTVNINPSSVTSFTAVASGNDSSIGLTWVNPTGTGVSATRICYVSSRMPTTSADGTYVTVSSAATAQYFNNLDNTGGVTWGFAAYVVDRTQEISVAATASALSVNAAPNPVTSFIATPSGNATIVLTWTNPSSALGVSLSAMKVNYTYGRLPSAITDSITIIPLASSAVTRTFTSLSNDYKVPYGFAIWVYDTGLQQSLVAYASAIPYWIGGSRNWEGHSEHIRMRNLGYI